MKVGNKREGRERESSPVCNNDGGGVFRQLCQSLLHNPLALSVQGRGGLVQQQDFRLPYQSPGNGNPLPLPTGQLGASLSHWSVVSLHTCTCSIVGYTPPHVLLHPPPSPTLLLSPSSSHPPPSPTLLLSPSPLSHPPPPTLLLSPSPSHHG